MCNLGTVFFDISSDLTYSPYKAHGVGCSKPRKKAWILRQQSDRYKEDMTQIDDEQPLGMVMVGAESGQKNCLSTALGDLPEPCIAYILRLTAPRDVARLACVSSTFRAASDSDLVWDTKLPPSYAQILAQASEPPSSSSKKKIYDFLCNRALFDNGIRDYWLDKATGGICQSIGTRGLSVTLGDDTRYWDWEHRRQGSRFTEGSISEGNLVARSSGDWSIISLQGLTICLGESFINPDISGQYNCLLRPLVMKKFKKFVIS